MYVGVHYTMIMEVTISEFRRNIFDLVSRAIEGTELWVIHKGHRLKIAPDQPPVPRLSRITPLEVINAEPADTSQPTLQEEMTRAWEKDWDTL